MLFADAYIDRIDFPRYLPQTDCGACGAKTCYQFIEGLKNGDKKPADCPDISESLYYPFQVALDADDILPKFPCLTAPRPGQAGLVEINTPGPDSPCLISGNNVHTQDVVTSVLSTTKSPFFLLFTDTKGNTVDMALIYESMTAEQLEKDLLGSGITASASRRQIILPGLAATVGDELRDNTGWNVIVGPICAAELPLFFADTWLPQPSIS